MCTICSRFWITLVYCCNYCCNKIINIFVMVIVIIIAYGQTEPLNLCCQVPGFPQHHQAHVRPVDRHGLQDRSGGAERPGEHPPSGGAGGQAGRVRHQPLLCSNRGGLRYECRHAHTAHIHTHTPAHLLSPVLASVQSITSG